MASPGAASGSNAEARRGPLHSDHLPRRAALDLLLPRVAGLCATNPAKWPPDG